MKTRVKATGNIVDVEWYGHDSMGTIYADVTHTTKYYEYELDFDTVYDYWTRLEHQYAGWVMQVLMTDPALINVYREDGKIAMKSFVEAAADICYDFSHALVEKMKEERK